MRKILDTSERLAYIGYAQSAIILALFEECGLVVKKADDETGDATVGQVSNLSFGSERNQAHRFRRMQQFVVMMIASGGRYGLRGFGTEMKDLATLGGFIANVLDDAAEDDSVDMIIAQALQAQAHAEWRQETEAALDISQPSSAYGKGAWSFAQYIYAHRSSPLFPYEVAQEILDGTVVDVYADLVSNMSSFSEGERRETLRQHVRGTANRWVRDGFLIHEENRLWPTAAFNALFEEKP